MLVERQLLLLRVGVLTSAERVRVLRYCRAFRAQVLRSQPGELVIELTGPSARLDCFENFLVGHDVRECVRSGPLWVNSAATPVPI